MHPDPKRVEALFAAVLEETTHEERLARLDEACAGDPLLRRRVEDLLAAHGEAGSFLEKPFLDKPLTDLAGDRTDSPAGSPAETEPIWGRGQGPSRLRAHWGRTPLLLLPIP